MGATVGVLVGVGDAETTGDGVARGVGETATRGETIGIGVREGVGVGTATGAFVYSKRITASTGADPLNTWME